MITRTRKKEDEGKMSLYWISFGAWSSKAGRFFLYDRVYRCVSGHWRWTPFVEVRLRYLRTMRVL